ncbi:hypothetical protein [Streptomyces sp. APSN-46.1]|uniref:hypothetical protein n=1 Tax=Streptomyces sp. APSN-46.1 TaxID=2929049 RepID=UPI0027E4E52F|nr:hypothetical protein [Streptomyces sp. APSN-46.1]
MRTSAGPPSPTEPGTDCASGARSRSHFAARRWTDRQLDAARHQSDLVPGPVIHLHTDHAVQGLGTAAVGPGVLPQYRPELASADFAFILTPLQQS